MIGIVVSRADAASEHVGEHLLALDDWDESADGSLPAADGGGTVRRTDGFELRTFDDLHLDLVGVADAFENPDCVVFVSRHAGDTGPLLTAHSTGNFGPAEYGGDDGDLALACPNAVKRVVAALDEHAPDGYDVSMECTHHGPTDVGAPSMFVELGSAEAQWRDADAARAVARSVLSLRGVDPLGERRLVAFGGGHYAPRPTRIARETDWAVGHVAADWGLDAMGDPREHRDVVRRAFERSGADRAVVEGEYPDLAAAIADLGYRVVSETWVRETDGVALPLVERLEGALCGVGDGLRFGAPATAAPEAADFDVVALPAGLLAAAHGVDADAALGAVRDAAFAYETEENGNRVAGRAAVPADAGVDAVVDGLVDVLAREYDSVDREADAVVARTVAFDPELARDRGVPEGPAFGRLAAGESVTVDGETVTPADVSRERIERFPL